MDTLERLRRLVARHGQDGLSETPLPRLSLYMARTATEPRGDLIDPGVVLVVHGAKRTTLGDQDFTYAAGDYLVASVGLPVTGAVLHATPSNPFLAVVLHLDPARLAAMLLELPAPTARAPAPFGLAVGHAGPALLDAAARLVELLDRPDDSAALAPLYERELLWRLLTGELGPSIRQIGLADSRVTYLGRAIARIRAHYDEPLKIDELASLAAMSPRSFHRHFRAMTSMTPLEYQKRLRLFEARARLAGGAHDVAAIGYAVGYASPSQFSREYRRLFGQPPSRDGGYSVELSITNR
jgi:AraC-like DNA-binding protein